MAMQGLEGRTEVIVASCSLSLQYRTSELCNGYLVSSNVWISNGGFALSTDLDIGLLSYPHFLMLTNDQQWYLHPLGI